MNRSLKVKISLLSLLLLMIVSACGGGGGAATGPTLSRAVLAREESGAQSSSVFQPADPVHLSVNLTAPADTRVKAVWTAVNAEGTAPNYLIDDSEQVYSGSGPMVFSLRESSTRPVGEYKVDLYFNDEMVQSLPFLVQAALGTSDPTPAAVAESTPEVTPSQAPPSDELLVNSLEELKTAAIQIEAEGSFIDPEFGMVYNAAGRGSGVIIDPSGIAVTNNHVVTGAALIQVWVGGETQPRNARILGVSECSDLAVIDLEGEGYPYVEWYDGNVNVGLDIYAAGFPLGNPEYTLTRGIVSKAQANGESDWASVDSVIEHDATINPGNSGGPLVTADGKLVGINYAGRSDTNQYFAILRSEAIPVINQLRSGTDVNSIGVNGMAVNNGEGLSGIWVSSVKSGSPADRAGIRGGDIITMMEGLVLATDYTMSDYCDILRTRNASDTMSVQVLRYSTQEVLEGQLNGRELAQLFSFAQTLEEEVPADTGNSGNSGNAGAAGYASYTVVTDDSGLLQVEVPEAWTDVNGAGWELEGAIIGAQVMAAPDLNGYLSTWDTPGVTFGASADLATVSPDELLDLIDFSESCTYDGREVYSDELYSGSYDVWSGCGSGDTLYVVVATMPETQDFMVLVQVQVVTEADLEALDHILASFVVSG